MVVRVLQLTDTHLFSSKEENLKNVVTFNSLKKVINLVKAQDEEFSFVTLTGDLSQDETKDSYMNLGDLVSQLKLKAFYIPGNHDNRSNMQEAFSCFSALESERAVFEKNWLFVFLDSKLDGQVEGFLAKKEMDELGKILLENQARYIAVFLHHNPISLDTSRVDRAMLTNSQEFLELLKANKNVKAVISGHVHQDYVEKQEGILFISSPSTCVQFKPSEEGVTVDNKLPGYRKLEFLDDGKVLTEVIRIKQ